MPHHNRGILPVQQHNVHQRLSALQLESANDLRIALHQSALFYPTNAPSSGNTERAFLKHLESNTEGYPSTNDLTADP